MQTLNNITTTDQYTEDSTVAQAGTVKVNVYVSNASVMCQMADPAPGLQHSDAWRPEVFYGPAHYNLQRKVNAVRVRSAAPGVPAQVTVELLTAHD
jgi:hypothetical protein